MGKGDTIVKDMKKSFMGCKFLALNINGFSGGLINGWTQNISLINSFVVCSSLSIYVFSKSIRMELSFLNEYGPYEGKQFFWSDLLSSQWIKVEKLIVGGDLNLTLNIGEIWGTSTRHDRLEDLFIE